MKYLFIIIIVILLMIPILIEEPKEKEEKKETYIKSSGKIDPINDPSYTSNPTIPNNTKVIGIVTDIPRAYPLNMMAWHLVVNEKDFSLTYCPLAQTVMGYHGLTLHASGKTLNGNSIFETSNGTLISQFTYSQDTIAAKITTWEDWKRTYPKSLLLNDTGHIRKYSINPYPANAHTQFPKNRRSNLLSPNERVMGHIETSEATLKLEGPQPGYIEAPWSVWYAFHPDTELTQ
ncbi:MAG: DUF3179 domain-containing (seleno)protein [Candidatus Woesearchaeota archaeon]